MALKVKVKKTVTLDIDIDQAGLEKLVRDHIAAEDPNIVVKAVKFVATRKPAGVAVEVEAEYRDEEEADDVKADVCKGCGEAVCECEAEEDSDSAKQEDAPDPEPEPAEEQLELEETEPEVTSEESFEDNEMDLIDETLAEHADDEDAAAMDLPDVDTDLPDGMDDLPDVDAEPAPKRKSLFAKD